MIQQCGRVNNCLILDCGPRKIKRGRAKTKKTKVLEETGTKTEQIPKRGRSCRHKRHTQEKAACDWSKTNPVGQVIFVVAALFTFLMYGLE